VIFQGDGIAVILTLAKKITSKLAEVRMIVPRDAPPYECIYCYEAMNKNIINNPDV